MHAALDELVEHLVQPASEPVHHVTAIGHGGAGLT
jgi:hypothetical protein